MNEVVNEWVVKAEGDFLTAAREAKANPPNYDAALGVCKAMKKQLSEMLTDNP